MLATPRRVEPPREPQAGSPPSAQDNSPAKPAATGTAEAVPVEPPPLFRARSDIPKAVDKAAAPVIPAVIPIVRPPDDPGIDEEAETDEFAERLAPAEGQEGGWRGFLSRWGG